MSEEPHLAALVSIFASISFNFSVVLHLLGFASTDKRRQTSSFNDNNNVLLSSKCVTVCDTYKRRIQREL